MKRKDLLAVSACTNKRFDNLALRKQLPFIPVPVPGLVDPQSERGRKMADYSLEDAFRLRLMLDLVENQGLNLDAAQYAARNAGTALRRDFYGANLDIDGPDIWLVFAQYRPTASGLVPRMLKGATLADMSRLIMEEINPDEARQELAFIVMVNASAISETVTANALAEAVISADCFDFKPLWLSAGEAAPEA